MQYIYYCDNKISTRCKQSSHDKGLENLTHIAALRCIKRFRPFSRSARVMHIKRLLVDTHLLQYLHYIPDPEPEPQPDGEDTTEDTADGEESIDVSADCKQPI